MSQHENLETIQDVGKGNMPAGESLQKNIERRRQIGKIWNGILFAATIFGFFVLLVLVYTIIDDAFGLVAVDSDRSLEEVTDGRALENMSDEELIAVIEENMPASQVRILQSEENFNKPLEEFSQAELIRAIEEQVMEVRIRESWTLTQSIFNRGAIEAEVAADEDYTANAELRWNSWLNWEFITTPMNTEPALTGVRTALFGSLWLIAITMVVAFPLGVGAAIYLEEYAITTGHPVLARINGIIQTNINNLAGVPSIIYGMLGLAIFVRALAPVTSGEFEFATQETLNGRTIISGGFTLALLILPLIIINSQEAIRAVPNSLRQASYGLGATKWQTIWYHILPVAVPGILTGTILAMSRAIGETAPLIVVGASTFITSNPEGPFSQFTALPIQIYNWAAEPDPKFENAGAAAIIVLLTILLSLNALAAWLRIRARKTL